MIQETEFIKKLLPDHYTCESRDNGVHCYSSVGIKDTFTRDEWVKGEADEWKIFVEKVKNNYGSRFMEINHQTSSNYLSFTIYFYKITDIQVIERMQEICEESLGTPEIYNDWLKIRLQLMENREDLKIDWEFHSWFEKEHRTAHVIGHDFFHNRYEGTGLIDEDDKVYEVTEYELIEN